MNISRRTLLQSAGAMGICLPSAKLVFADAGCGDVDGGSAAEAASQSDVEDVVNHFFKQLPEANSADGTIPTELRELQRSIERSLQQSDVNAVWCSPEMDSSEAEATTRRVHLGESPLPNQHRVHRHGFSLKWETRQARIKVWADISHPDLNDFANDAIQCAIGAATASVITAAVASPAAGLAAFLPAFKACLMTKVSATVAQNTSVRLDSKTHHTCWSNHC